MLTFGHKNNRTGHDELAEGEFRLLVSAFGRNGGTQEQRGLAQPVVRKYQDLGSGRWFYCDCRRGEGHSPVLYPSDRKHVVRHPKRSQHDEACAFFCPPRVEWRTTISHRDRERPKGYGLLRNFSNALGASPHRETVHRSQNVRRPGLATLLCKILTLSGLMIVGPDGFRPTHKSQLRTLYLSAASEWLADDIPLLDFLRTGFERQDELVEKVAAGAGKWSDGTRPHGLLIDTIRGVAQGNLVKRDGSSLAVAGRISVFGERSGDNRLGSRSEDVVRAGKSYVAIVLFARLVPNGPVVAHSAYVHPCLKMEDFLLVDSDFERQTFSELSQVRSWISKGSNVSFSVEKPLFDIGRGEPEEEDLRDGNDEDAPVSVTAPPVLLPDFIVHRSGYAAAGNPTVIVETMGYDDATYRERKRRIVPAMTAAMGGVPCVKHDFCRPANKSQDERDKTFRGYLRRELTGPW